MIILKIKEATVAKLSVEPEESTALSDDKKISVPVSDYAVDSVIGMKENHLLVIKDKVRQWLFLDHLVLNGVIIIKATTFGKLTENPVDSSLLTTVQRIVLEKGSIVLPDEIIDHRDNHIRVKDITGKKYWLFLPHLERTTLPDSLFELVQLDKLITIVGNKQLATRHHAGINRTLAEFDIDNFKRITCFLAQVLHESGGLKWSEELASGRAYEGRTDLGNVHAGDGVRFKGRGLIQLTGRHNYGVAGKKLGLDLINLPQLASSDEHSARIAGWYWDSRGLNKHADVFTISAFQTITRRINGGLNGYKDRLHWWDKCRLVLR